MKANQITVIGHYGISLIMDVAHFPAEGETVEASALNTEPGGKGYNQSVAAARLGANVRFITAVGDDEYGRTCASELEREGVGGAYITTFAGQRTAIGIALLTPDRKNQVIIYPGAIRRLEPKHIREHSAQIESSGLLIVQNEISRDAVIEAAAIAFGAGVPVVYNPAPAKEMPKQLFSHIDCITPNETEAALLCGFDPAAPLDLDAAIDALHALGARNVVITLGAKGSLVSAHGQERAFIEPYAVTPINTVGAGDCFTAALALRFLECRSYYVAARFASVAAGMAVASGGILDGIPTRKELDAEMKRLGLA